MELLEILVTGPVFPATVAVGLAVLWSLVTLFGVGMAEGGLEGSSSPDLEHGLDLDASLASDVLGDGSVVGSASPQLPSTLQAGVRELALEWLAGTSIGTLRWLNIGGVPLMIWGAICAVAWWFVSGVLWIGIDRHLFEATLFWSIVLATRNLILASILTKLVTTPLKRSLTPNRITTQSLIGRECEISSTEATPEFGLVKFKTGGAPLLLNVRTDGPRLPQGTPVWIVHYDKNRKTYLVSPTSTSSVDPVAEQLKGESKDADL